MFPVTNVGGCCYDYPRQIAFLEVLEYNSSSGSIDPGSPFHSLKLNHTQILVFANEMSAVVAAVDEHPVFGIWQADEKPSQARPGCTLFRVEALG